MVLVTLAITVGFILITYGWVEIVYLNEEMNQRKGMKK
jgi:hypothetical protein